MQQQGKPEGEGEEEESDLEQAWNLLDIARVIFEGDKESPSILALSDVYSALGELSMEREDWETCVQDLQKSIEVRPYAVENQLQCCFSRST